MQYPFSIIVAATQNNGIGYENRIPWFIKEDIAEFKRITSEAKVGAKNVVIMGRKTWESIPQKMRPLVNRINIVVSGTIEKPSSTELIVRSFPEAFEKIATLAKNGEEIGEIFVMGGSSLYRRGLQSDNCQTIYLTNVFVQCNCDTFLPPIDLTRFELSVIGSIQQSQSGDKPFFQMVQYKKRHEEHQYLDTVRQCIFAGNNKNDRTGTGTWSLFGTRMRFCLENNTIPLLTTKKVDWRSIVEELLWMIAGGTDTKKLSNKRVKIWDKNGSRDFLDRSGFTEREVGDLGPVYGHQWRHFGAEYVDCKTNYTGQGEDQLQNVIKTIRSNPDDRRMLVCSWNPTDLKKMALPPCHVLFQFYVFEGKLSCQMYQRSVDLGLGACFNIASYSLLTAMIAQICNLEPHEFVYCLGDYHVYKNHVEPLMQQLTRQPRPFPKLLLNKERTEIDQFTSDDIQLVEYDPHPKIRMEMAI